MTMSCWANNMAVQRVFCCVVHPGSSTLMTDQRGICLRKLNSHCVVRRKMIGSLYIICINCVDWEHWMGQVLIFFQALHYNMETFHLREKQIPVDTLELKGTSTFTHNMLLPQLRKYSRNKQIKRKMFYSFSSQRPSVLSPGNRKETSLPSFMEKVQKSAPVFTAVIREEIQHFLVSLRLRK